MTKHWRWAGLLGIPAALAGAALIAEYVGQSSPYYQGAVLGSALFTVPIAHFAAKRSPWQVRVGVGFLLALCLAGVVSFRKDIAEKVFFEKTKVQIAEAIEIAVSETAKAQAGILDFALFQSITAEALADADQRAQIARAISRRAEGLSASRAELQRIADVSGERLQRILQGAPDGRILRELEEGMREGEKSRDEFLRMYETALSQLGEMIEFLEVRDGTFDLRDGRLWFATDADLSEFQRLATAYDESVGQMTRLGEAAREGLARTFAEADAELPQALR